MSKPSLPVTRPIAGIFLFYVIGTAITVVLPLYVRDTLGASDLVSTLFLAIFTIGTLIGALSVAFLARGKSGLGISAIAMVVAAVISVIVYFISLPELSVVVGECRGGVNVDDCRSLEAFFAGNRQYALAILLFISAMCSGMFIVPMQTAIQRRVQPKHRAQIISAGNILNALGAILGSLSIYTITVSTLSPQHAFIGAGDYPRRHCGLYVTAQICRGRGLV